MTTRALLLCALLTATSCCSTVGTGGTGRCFIDSDHQDLPRPRTVTRRSAFRERFAKVLGGMLVGVGDRYDHYLRPDDREPIVLHQWARDSGAPVNAQAIWLTREWQENWVSRAELERMASRGVIPVLMLYYFGGDISRREVLASRKEWFFYLMRVAALADIDHPVLVVLEPEFNDFTNWGGVPVPEWPGFAEIMIDGIYLLRSLAPNLLVGICPGDFGNQNLEPVLTEVAAYSDFIAFQEMRAVTQPSPINEEFEDVTGRAVSYSSYLHRTFGLPVLLAYVAVSTHDPDKQRWERYQADVLDNLFAARGKLRENGLFGMLYFMLFDDPQHQGWFCEAEPYFGLFDGAGRPKAGWTSFVAGINQMIGELARW